MFRAGINKLHNSRKPIALKPLPQFEETQRSPGDWKSGEVSTKYSPGYGPWDGAQELLVQYSPAARNERILSSRLPPREFPVANKSKRRRFTFHFVLLSFLFITIFTPLYITRRVIYPLKLHGGNLPFFDCTHTGNFSFQGIDVPFGEMKFANAKWIDLAFNAVIGRGLQTTLAWLCYRLFNVVLMSITESHRISYKLFAALALAPTRTDTIKPTLKSFFGRLPGFVKFQLFWLLLTTLYLAFFPSMIDSISGYQAIQSTMLKLPNSTTLDTPLRNNIAVDGNFATTEEIYKYVPPRFATLENVTFTYSQVSAGAWIKQGSSSPSPAVYGYGTNITSNPFPLRGSDLVLLNSTETYISICINSTTSAVHPMKWLSRNDYTESFKDGNDGCSKMDLKDYGAAVLEYQDDSCDNWYHLQGGFVGNEGIMIEYLVDSIGNKLGPGSSPVPCTPSWNTNYFYDADNYECVANGKLKYQWGFSYEFLLVACSINSTWLLITYFIFLKASSRSQLTSKGRKFGVWRGLIDLAEALREDLGTETCAYGEDDIEKEISKMEKLGQGVKYGVTGGGLPGDEESEFGKENPRLRLSSTHGDGRVFVQHGMVYG